MAAGIPLPPGGVFVYNQNAVLMDAAQKLKKGICRDLKLGGRFVQIDMTMEDNGIVTDARVDPPEEWFKEMHVANGGKSPDREMVKKWIAGILNVRNQNFKTEVEERIKYMGRRRPDLDRPIIDILNAAH